jgi:exodeoxyribonuclease V alpha subunit
MSKEYVRMLYNKLLYTGVSRAKKTLVMCGDPGAFMMAVNNNYSKGRKTTLKDKIIESYNN